MKKILLFSMLFFISAYLTGIEETGNASWYGPNFHGKKTANGEIFNTLDFTAAHRTLPFGSIVKITSLENNKTTFARINDRGPFKDERIIDLSKSCADEIDMVKSGVMKVKLELVEKGNNSYHKYSTKKKYRIQVCSFSDKIKAESLYNDLLKKNFCINIRQVIVNAKFYYRLLIEDLNYYELQEYRVRLHKEGLSSYMIVPS